MQSVQKCGIMVRGDDGRMKYAFTEEEIVEIQETRRKNRDKNVDRRLKALELKAAGRTGQEIAEITGYHSGYVTKLAAKYRKGGIEAIAGNHYGGNRRNMTYEEEAELLEQFIHAADGGHITDVSAIKTAYDEKIGHKTGHGQIYYVLHRHGWSKKMPRSKHPKSAAPEAIDASKKLTPESMN